MDCDEAKVSLKMILSFFTGADNIPALGYTLLYSLLCPLSIQTMRSLKSKWMLALVCMGGLDCCKMICNCREMLSFMMIM